MRKHISVLLSFFIFPLFCLAINGVTPVVTDIENQSDVIPGVTKIILVGSGFGTTEQSWSGTYAHSDIKIGGIEITKAWWSDNRISFTAPEGLAKSYQSGSSNSNQVLIELSVNGYTNFQQLSALLKYEAANPPYNDPFLYKQSYLYSINAFNGWNLQRYGDDVIVAVIDDGVYINHPDLRDSIWNNKKEIIGNKIDDDKNGYTDDIYGWDFVSNTPEMTTYGSHGTRVAGIIAANRNNNVGISGIASGAKTMPLIACDTKGCSTDAVSKAIIYATDNGANIINLSLATQGVTTYTDKFDAAIKYAFLKGVVIVAAAGNGDTQGQLGQSLDQIPVSPACNDNQANMVLGVSGVDSFGNYLSWANYGKCVDVVAPALNIFSTSIPDSSGYFYNTEDGTSFSAPIVASLAALMKAKYPLMSNVEIIDRIIENSSDKKDYNHALGGGLIDMYQSLNQSYTPSLDRGKGVLDSVIIDTVPKINASSSSVSNEISGKIKDTKKINVIEKATTTLASTSVSMPTSISTSTNINIVSNNKNRDLYFYVVIFILLGIIIGMIGSYILLRFVRIEK